MIHEPYHREDGRELRVKLVAVDSGGHHQHQVLTYCRRRKGVLPIKGIAGPKPIWPPRASRTKSDHRIYMVGVDTAKDTIYARLRFEEPGAGYVHFPVGGAFDAEYFAQLTSEEVQTRYSEGRPYRVWVLPEGKRNEVLDCWVYALCSRTALPYRLDIGPPKKPAPAPPPAEPKLEPAYSQAPPEEPPEPERPPPGTMRSRISARPGGRPIQVVDQGVTRVAFLGICSTRGGYSPK